MKRYLIFLWLTKTARFLVDTKTDINHLLYVTVKNEIEMKQRPVFDQEHILDFMAGKLTQLIVRTFARPGMSYPTDTGT